MSATAFVSIMEFIFTSELSLGQRQCWIQLKLRITEP